MEPLASTKRLNLLAAMLALAASIGIFSCQEQPIARMPFGNMLRTGLPMLDLTVVLRDRDNKNLEPADTLLGSAEKKPDQDAHCPTLTGGDTGSPTHINLWEKHPADCPQAAVWYVKKHPVAITLHFNDGDKVLAWWDKQPQMQLLRDSRFMQGLFFGLLKSMKIKAEQLNLQGLQGEFLAQLLRDAIAANAELHYDIAHGEQGWVLRYRRGGDFAEQALPALAGLLADNGYRLAKLPEPIVAVRIGLQPFFVTEYQAHIYLAQSLEALLNVIESLEPEERHADTPLSVTLRTEAFVDNLLPILTNTATAPIELSFTLQDGDLGALTIPGGPWQAPLYKTIFEGVLASIPHDAFAAVAGSFRLPPTLGTDDWKQFAAKGPARTTPNSGPGGLALIWDFDGFSPSGAVGIAIANPEQPAASANYRQYLRNTELSGECAGGSVFLAASAQTLLSRMEESCERQALSPLDWQQGTEKPRYLSSQLLSFVNPGVALRELFLSGGADAGDNKAQTDFAPRWQQQYEQAKTAMRQDGEKLFGSLPIFSYAGQAETGAQVRLEGKAINQGAGQ